MDIVRETVAGTRAAAHELAEVGVPHHLAWQVVEKHGANAMAALAEDPYSTLRPFHGYSFRSVLVAVMSLSVAPFLTLSAVQHLPGSGCMCDAHRDICMQAPYQSCT